MWDASTFSKNRDRLLKGDLAVRFLATLMARPWVKRLLSSDHFSVDSTMVQANAVQGLSSMKSVKPIECGEGSGRPSGDEPPPSSRRCNAEADFRGTTRTNATPASTTAPRPSSAARAQAATRGSLSSVTR